MPLNTTVTFKEKKTTIHASELGLLIELNETTTFPKIIAKDCLYLLLKDKLPIELTFGETTQTTDFNQLITIQLNTLNQTTNLGLLLFNYYQEKEIPLVSIKNQANLTDEASTLSETLKSLLLILKSFGVFTEKSDAPKKRPAKARHRWTKEVSEIDFFIDTRNSLATVKWIKRNQLLIKKGATMMKEAPLNKDGSVGFSAKAGTQLRSEHTDDFKHFVTTEDIILKSVNEVGLFLYFAGTNSWLELKDKDGKTLNEWTVVD